MNLNTISGMIYALTNNDNERTLYIMTFNRLFVVKNSDLHVSDGFIKGKTDCGDSFVIPFDKIEYITA